MSQASPQAPRPRRRKRRRVEPAESFDLGSLNPMQCKAVLHDDGPMLVLAGAGSGKTRVIIYRIVRLTRDGIDPDRILGVTFTNKAAKEMRERLLSLGGSDVAGVTLSTFHSLGLTILKDEYKHAGLRKGFCIYDTSDQLSLVRELMRKVKVADRRIDTSKVLDLILKTKKERLKEVPLDYCDDYEYAAYELYPRYIEEMRAFNAIDFDDLIIRALDVLEIDEVRERWGQRYDYLLVDEYQDTSPDQLKLIRTLAGERHNVCVVGDDDQSIYGWRGAAVDNILSFGKQFKGTLEVVLDQNYRSTGNILEAANSVIKNNVKRKSKNLWSAGGAGEPVDIVTCNDAEDEAAFVMEQITRLAYDGVKYGNMAVLYRSNTQSRIFEEILALERIPFRVVGGQAFFDRKEVRDFVAYLSLLHNPSDEISLRRIINVPGRGIGATSVQRISDYAEANGIRIFAALQKVDEIPGVSGQALRGVKGFLDIINPAIRQAKNLSAGQLTDFGNGFLEEIKLRDAVVAADDAPKIAIKRLENINEVINALSYFAKKNPDSTDALADFLRNSSLVRSPEDKEEDHSGQVTLMTLHSAKGLEFPYVFMVGVEEDLLPHRKSVDGGGEISEERRLMYVGITRAKKQLWINWCRRRMQRGKWQDRGSSRFLEEIPEGEGVRRWKRDAPPENDDSEELATNFFARMRDELGISED